MAVPPISKDSVVGLERAERLAAVLTALQRGALTQVGFGAGEGIVLDDEGWQSWRKKSD